MNPNASWSARSSIASCRTPTGMNPRTICLPNTSSFMADPAQPGRAAVHRAPDLCGGPRSSCGRFVWDYSRRLEFDFSGPVEQVGDEDHRHRGVMLAHEPPPDTPELRARFEVGGLVAAVACHPA